MGAQESQFKTQELLLLGEIKGLVQGLKEGQDLQNKRFDKVDERLDGVDERLRTVEQKAAVAGALSGGAMALGTALIVEGIKHWLGRGG
jgi:hypothetical protein